MSEMIHLMMMSECFYFISWQLGCEAGVAKVFGEMHKI